MRRIESADNPNVKFAKRLLTKRGRDQSGFCLIEGSKLLGEALDCGAKTALVFFCEDGGETEPADAYAALAARSKSAGAEIVSVPRRIFESVTDARTPQGVVAAVEKPSVSEAAFFEAGRGGGNYVVLDRIGDPGNIGTLVRTADAAGFAGVLAVKGTGDLYAPKTLRAAAGSLFRVPVLYAADAAVALALLSGADKRVVATDPRAPLPCFGAVPATDVALAVGSEGSGLDAVFRRGAAITVGIPMLGGAESLNVSVAAAIIMFECVRRQLAADGNAESK